MHFTNWEHRDVYHTNVKTHHSLCERSDAVVQRWGNMSGVETQSKQPGASSSSVCAGEQRPKNTWHATKTWVSLSMVAAYALNYSKKTQIVFEWK